MVALGKLSELTRDGSFAASDGQGDNSAYSPGHPKA